MELFHGDCLDVMATLPSASIDLILCDLPYGTRLKVCLRSCVVVRINDRGPFVRGRSLDLSRGAAMAIGLSGVAAVRVEVL